MRRVLIASDKFKGSLTAAQVGEHVAAGLRAAFDIEDRFAPVSVIALGTLGDVDALPEPLRERELAPRTRLPLGQVVVVDA